MTLRQKQSLFVECLVRLWDFGHSRGWAFTLGEAGVINPRKVWVHHPRENNYVTETCADHEHMEESLHYKRLAIDVNLFVNGRYIRSGTNPAYLELGEYWEGLHALASWGGRFGDANHFSIRHAGKA